MRGDFKSGQDYKARTMSEEQYNKEYNGHSLLTFAKNLNLVVGTVLVVISIYNVIAIWNAFDFPTFLLDIYSG